MRPIKYSDYDENINSCNNITLLFNRIHIFDLAYLSYKRISN